MNTTSKTRPGLRAGSGVHHALERVRERAARDRKVRFTALLHHVSLEQLEEAFFALRKKAAPGIDGVTWEQYGESLSENLRDLHGRVHRGTYRAKPARRAYIPKTDGRQRPLGIAALEDKVVQRAVVEVMNRIYETEFLDFSHGFRPQRSAHDALDALAYGIRRCKVNWVLDADIRGFFESIDHGWLRQFLEHRIGDRRLLRLIQRWLDAGVIENGAWQETAGGTPQGATISPLLANLYLHHVFDLWAQQWRRRHARGEILLVRYADDFIVGFEKLRDAEQFLAELRQRLRRFGLELHPEKTRLIEFGRFAAKRRQTLGLGRPETFHFLGFTHICGESQAGGFVLVRHTQRDRMRDKLHTLQSEMQRRRNLPTAEQGEWLRSVLRGYNSYYGVPTNSRALQSFRTQLTWLWFRSLRRRGQRRKINWKGFRQLARRWLPTSRILHPWPDERFAARASGRSPVR
ncbi:MAG TPA: group II intron reverse transcriptase/maturase [Thermoanaerobaculia bacterium]|nr:group II intron reverse transcriptase/maturase [Thermoanaerobaculia bacterium]